MKHPALVGSTILFVVVGFLVFARYSVLKADREFGARAKVVRDSVAAYRNRAAYRSLAPQQQWTPPWRQETK